MDQGHATGLADPEVWAPRLVRLLERQRALYADLDALSQTQGPLIASDQTDRLLEVLARRQGLIDELSTLNQEIAPFTGDWARLSGGLSDPHRLAIRERFEAVSALAASIASRDEEHRRALEARRAGIGSELAGLARARGAAAAYSGSASASPTPRYQDREG